MSFNLPGKNSKSGPTTREVIFVAVAAPINRPTAILKNSCLAELAFWVSLSRRKELIEIG